MNATSKCAHPACSCAPAADKKHCSDACADTKNAAKTTCECKHPVCQHSAIKA